MDSARLVEFFLYLLTSTILDIIHVPKTSAYSVNSSLPTNRFMRIRRQAATQSDWKCILPNHPENGRWDVHGDFAAEPGQNVGANTLVIYSCDKGYKLSSGDKLVVCLPDGWSVKHLTCLPLCPPLYTTALTKVKCLDKYRNEIKCDEATDESSAKFECASSYEPADRQMPILNCWAGSWNLPPPQCVPVCGEKKVSAQPLIMNGVTVKNGDYPWVTAIFQKTDQGFVNVCGGSMLTQKVILTAASCVADQNGNAQDKATFKVAVGKYFNKYEDTRDTQAQYSDVQKILVHPKYKGQSQWYTSDIAFLVTKDTLLLSSAVQPVCFNNLPNIPLNLRSRGVISGWDYTTAGEDPSEELNEVSVPFKDDATCNSELPSDRANNYYGYDKFCAGNFNKSIAISSGNGLVFKNPKDGRFYVHGILSEAIKVENVGDKRVGFLYTKVAEHYERLEQIVSQYTRP